MTPDELERKELGERLLADVIISKGASPMEIGKTVRCFILGNQTAYENGQGGHRVYISFGEKDVFPRIDVHADDDVVQVMIEYAVDKEMQRRYKERNEHKQAWQEAPGVPDLG